MPPRFLVRSRPLTILLTAVLATAVPWALHAAPRVGAARRFTLRSATLPPQSTFARAQVYNKYGCRGRNISPALLWRNPPRATRSFAVLMFDPDAPGGVWWHWLLFDLPASTRALMAGAGDPGGSLPNGARQARNDYGTVGYGGPCPPPGPPHHYHITLYALRVAHLDLPNGAPADTVAAAVRAAAIARTGLVIPYGR